MNGKRKKIEMIKDTFLLFYDMLGKNVSQFVNEMITDIPTYNYFLYFMFITILSLI